MNAPKAFREASKRLRSIQRDAESIQRMFTEDVSKLYREATELH